MSTSTSSDSKSTTPAKASTSTKSKPSKTKVKPSKLSLVQAQAKQQAQMGSNSASLEQIRGFLSKKGNRGKYFTPSQIATAIGEGTTDKGIRKTLQKAGLAKGKETVIETDSLWLCLAKSGNKNAYCAVTPGTTPPVVQ